MSVIKELEIKTCINAGLSKTLQVLCRTATFSRSCAVRCCVIVEIITSPTYISEPIRETIRTVYNKHGGRCSQTRVEIRGQFGLGFQTEKEPLYISFPTIGKPSHGPVVQ